MNYDVIVVGGGTAGSYASILLGRLGFKVALIEMKRRDEVFKVTGDAIGLHHLEYHGLRPPERVIVQEYDGVELYSPDLSIKYVIPGKGVSLDMREWARWLLGEAERVGVEILDCYKAQGPILNGDKVVGVKALRPDGQVVELHGKVIIDASGFTGVIRMRVPDPYISEPLLPEDASYTYREIVEVEHEIENPRFIRIYLNAEVATGGYWWFFPKGRHTANVGLGVWGKLTVEQGLNPIRKYEAYIPRFIGRRTVIHAGGGIVPTRRPLPSMVSNGLLAIGDAGLTVNPLHGGGLGPALLAARLAVDAIVRAFEKGDFTREGLWSFNVEYIKRYGRKQAMLDILRLMLQTMNNEELNHGLKARLLTEEEVLRIAEKGSFELSLFDKLKVAFRMLRIPSVARKLLIALKYMREAEALYDKYPTTPSGLDLWLRQLVDLYTRYSKELGTGIKWPQAIGSRLGIP